MSQVIGNSTVYSTVLVHTDNKENLKATHNWPFDRGIHWWILTKGLQYFKKRLVRTITCSPYPAQTVPLFYADNLLNVCDINSYTIGIFMYQFVNGNLPDIFNGFLVRNRDRNVHQYNVRNADELYVSYARLDVRKFCLKMSCAKLWNVFPIT